MSEAERVVGTDGRLGAWKLLAAVSASEGKERPERPRFQDEEVEAAFHHVLRATLDQRRPSRALVKSVNVVLDLVSHPLALKRK